jgi:hypothetical protein
MFGWKRYLVVFLITVAIFLTAIAVSDVLSQKRLQDIAGIENRISLNLDSLETQFELLKDAPCSASDTLSISEDLSTLAKKLEYASNNLPANAPELDTLRRQYSLFEVKDYLLNKTLRDQCHLPTTFILYFYADDNTCTDCDKMGTVLTYLREQDENLRVYSFDYRLDLPVVESLISLYKIEDNLPALLIEGKPSYGFKSVEEMETLLAPYQKATSTKATTTKSITR